jgi:hypothetical protein
MSGFVDEMMTNLLNIFIFVIGTWVKGLVYLYRAQKAAKRAKEGWNNNDQR